MEEKLKTAEESERGKNNFIDELQMPSGRWSTSWRRMLGSLDSNSASTNPFRSTCEKDVSYFLDWLVAIVKNCENYEKNILIDANGDDDAALR
jgi:hypothetical protein